LLNDRTRDCPKRRQFAVGDDIFSKAFAILVQF
jgi:hypothetical protein